MPQRYPPINPRCPHFLYGGDYNPDQWLDTPQILDEDMRLMKLANCNAMSVGIFSWTSLEPREGVFEFGWLDDVMDRLTKNGAFAVLATPSGARPPWMSAAYPEVLRVNGDRKRILHGTRHNHCYTSPVYREKVGIINRRLADRYKDHPALLVWHVSNEYSGECHCPLCQDAFRSWLRHRYDDSLDRLNHAWSTRFWGSVFSDWSQIESPAPHGETVRHGLSLDWKRFVTHQTIDFFKAEAAPLKELTPNTPVTTNFAGIWMGFDLWKFAREVDVVAWDSYPSYQDQQDMWKAAVEVSFSHDLMRSLKGGRPYLLMECSPSATNWSGVCKLKRPGVLRLEALQAVAHGADTVQYFQFRKNQGGAEKFHGAIVDHCGHENTRVFGDVAGIGGALRKFDDIIGTTVDARVAMFYDWDNRWIIEEKFGGRNDRKEYLPVCQEFYRTLWSRGIPVDFVNSDSDLSKYRLLIAPQLYMILPGVRERIAAFVEQGGVLVTTWYTGIADENDRCFLGGWPGGVLRKVLGVWAEEIDALHDDEKVAVVARQGNSAGLSGTYDARFLCDLIHTEGAEVLAEYGSEFYAGQPAVTCNRYGKGAAYYIASRNDDRFRDDFLGHLCEGLGISPALSTDLPEGVTAKVRTDGKRDFVFLLNSTRNEHRIVLTRERFLNVETGEEVRGEAVLSPYGAMVLVREHG